MHFPIVKLQKNQERRLLAGHLWVYSNEIDTKATPLKSFLPGQLVMVKSDRDKALGIGYINPNTLLSVRLLTRYSGDSIDVSFFEKRLRRAVLKRDMLFDAPYYRCVFGEADELPGLIMDRFNDVWVMQINTAGMQACLSLLLPAILNVFQPQSILLRNDSSYRTLEGLPQEIVTLHGEPPETVSLIENGCSFRAPIRSGQKTGWFFDHRFSRDRITHYVNGKTVLDVFSYLGAFAVPMAKAGAKSVTCIDSSSSALAILSENAELNGVSGKVSVIEQDAFEALESLKQSGTLFDVIVLDPPALIKRQKDKVAGMQAYRHLNQCAMELLSPNGILLSASCSMHLSRDDLLNQIRQAGIGAKKSVSVLEQLHQAADHPVHPAIPESDYLKGFILSVS